jgi:hypothetical protein
LERWALLNPKKDFSVIVHGWESLYWSHPLLQSRTFGAHQKGLFDTIVKNSTIISPEPYHVTEFFQQKVNLIEAFDIAINKGKKRDIYPLSQKPNLYLSNFEKSTAMDFIENHKSKAKKRRAVLFQPFGSAAHVSNKVPLDPSNRSLEFSNYLHIVKELGKHAVVFFASKPELKHPQDDISIIIDGQSLPYFRMLIALSYHVDLFCGVDSVGQHVFRAFNKPGIVFMGGTNDVNFTYPNHYKIYRKANHAPVYSPWRLMDSECEFADRENDGIMIYDTKDLKIIDGMIQKELSDNTFEKVNDKVGICYQ